MKNTKIHRVGVYDLKESNCYRDAMKKQVSIIYNPSTITQRGGASDKGVDIVKKYYYVRK